MLKGVAMQKRLKPEEASAIEEFLAKGGDVERLPPEDRPEPPAAPLPERIHTPRPLSRKLPRARGGLPGTRSAPRSVSIRQLLEWAFRVERASVDFGPAADIVNPPRTVGMEFILIERARLGCQVDGGGRSNTHPDADTVASAVAALPEANGGRRMAIWIAELAREGAEPDWMPGARPRLEPVEMHINQFGQTPATADAAILGARGWQPTRRVSRKGRQHLDPVLYTPCHWPVRAETIAAARRRWLDWCMALLTLRTSFQVYGGLTAFRLTDEMPPVQPWRGRENTKC